MPDDSYSPESIRVLVGMEPRPEGVTIGTGPEHWWASIDGLAPEPVALWRDAGSEQDPPQPWGAERLGHEGVLWPDRVRLIARAIPPEEPSDVRYSVEDGPGSSDRVELAVRVLIGSERSTIVVADPVTGQALQRDVVPHGGEAGAAAAAVYAAIKKRNARL
ncbi:hypothetical protein [Methylobacterium sp. A52T]